MNSQEKGICFDFLKGTCSRGLLCRFSHDLSNLQPQLDTPSVTTPQRRQAPICYDFVKGACTRGAECRYSHDYSAILTAPRPQSTGLVLCLDWAGGRCMRGSSCRYSHGDSTVMVGASGYQVPSAVDPKSMVAPATISSHNNLPAHIGYSTPGAVQTQAAAWSVTPGPRDFDSAALLQHMQMLSIEQQQQQQQQEHSASTAAPPQHSTYTQDFVALSSTVLPSPFNDQAREAVLSPPAAAAAVGNSALLSRPLTTGTLTPGDSIKSGMSAHWGLPNNNSLFIKTRRSTIADPVESPHIQAVWNHSGAASPHLCSGAPLGVSPPTSPLLLPGSSGLSYNYTDSQSFKNVESIWAKAIERESSFDTNHHHGSR